MRLWCSGSTADFAVTFIRRKAWVRIPPASLVRRAARWSEQRPYKTKVDGSIPSTPTFDRPETGGRRLEEKQIAKRFLKTYSLTPTAYSLTWDCGRQGNAPDS